MPMVTANAGQGSKRDISLIWNPTASASITVSVYPFVLTGTQLFIQISPSRFIGIFIEQVSTYETGNPNYNPLSPSGLFMGQKVGITSPIPSFKG